MNVYFDGLRVCLYDTARGVGGFVEETRCDGSLLGFVSAPDPITAALQAARIVSIHRKQ